jgi:hypothetical protein
MVLIRGTFVAVFFRASYVVAQFRASSSHFNWPTRCFTFSSLSWTLIAPQLSSPAFLHNIIISKYVSHIHSTLQLVPPKYWCPLTGPHGVITQRTIIWNSPKKCQFPKRFSIKILQSLLSPHPTKNLAHHNTLEFTALTALDNLTDEDPHYVIS